MALWKRAADLGNSNAKDFLSLPGVLTPEELEALIRKAESGDAKAQHGLALQYETGTGVRKNTRRAVYWYRKAAEQHHPGAMNNLAFYYQKGKGGVRKNISKALQLWIDSARAGDASALMNLAEAWRDGTGFPADPVIAHVFYSEAVKAIPEARESLDQLALRMRFRQIEQAETMTLDEALERTAMMADGQDM